MIITKLKECKDGKWLLEINNGQRKYHVNASIIDKHGLRQGQTISIKEMSYIIGEINPIHTAISRALYLIGERDMCRGELLKKLTRTYGAEIAEQVVEHVCSLGYVNDEKYAPKLAEYLIKRKRWGIRRVRYEMLSRGLDRELVENTLADIDEDELDEELITLIEKRYINKIADYDDRRRTIAALARRGYDFSSIKRCIEAVLEGVEDDFDDYNEFDEE